MPIWERLALFTLTCWGVTNVLSGSRLLKPLRDRLKPVPFLGDMLSCYMCAGWWIGGALSAAGMSLDPSSNPFLGVLRDAFVGSGVCWIIHVVLVRLGSDEL